MKHFNRTVRDRLLVALVPVLLSAVAAVQIYLVDRNDLSRWKGGGFGMFTTVDSPSARVFFFYLSTSDGEIPVMVPRDLAKLSHKARVMPTAERITVLAQRLQAGTWIPLTMVSASQHYLDLLKSAGPGYDQSADDISYQAASGVPHLDFDELQLVRMLEEDEPIPQDTPLEVSGVRVEVWRYRFDREELVLRAEKIAQAFSRGQTGG